MESDAKEYYYDGAYMSASEYWHKQYQKAILALNQETLNLRDEKNRSEQKSAIIEKLTEKENELLKTVQQLRAENDCYKLDLAYWKNSCKFAEKHNKSIARYKVIISFGSKNHIVFASTLNTVTLLTKMFYAHDVKVEEVWQ